ncbi:MAG: hypothetical protein ACFFCM_03040 [Promethearchaeota archaeon]
MSRKIDSIIKDIEKNKALTGNSLELLVKEYGERFWRAIRAVSERAVKKYTFQPSGQIVWIVVGKTRDYLISLEDRYCTCDDFYVNVVLKKNSDVCYHVLAKILAEIMELYNTYTVDDERYPNMMEEWKQI